MEKDETLYVISGFMRTGTSMMMKALEEGGLKAEYKQSRDEMKNHFADESYDPNIGGLYELEAQDYQELDFPIKYGGKLIKGLNQCIPRMSVMPNGIKVVFMMRDAEEIRQSYEGFFGRPLQHIEQYEKNMKKIIKLIKNRKDVISVHIFQYREVLENPLKHFQILKDAGWPINVEACIKVVDAKYCRFKKEILTPGI